MPIYLAGVLALARVLRRVTVAGSAVAGVLAAALQTRRHRETRRQDGLSSPQGSSMCASPAACGGHGKVRTADIRTQRCAVMSARAHRGLT